VATGEKPLPLVRINLKRSSDDEHNRLLRVLLGRHDLRAFLVSPGREGRSGSGRVNLTELAGRNARPPPPAQPEHAAGE
jgi:hypothetical protein